MTPTVPFRNSALSRRACEAEPGHERKPPANSGFWTCSLKTLTPLCIQSAFRNLKDEDAVRLPASSLRGMVRNMVEVLGAGCARYLEGVAEPPQLSRCTEFDACLACRLFGFVEGKFAWAGKVRFSDSVPQKVKWTKVSVPVDRPPHDDRQGWLLFRHEEPRLRVGPTRCIEQGQQFRFRVEYINLDPEELAVLRFGLTLSHRSVDLCHKLGYAKSLGLGSCKISIVAGKAGLPEIGPEIEPYLSTPAMAVVMDARRYKR
jgi:CRISPR/Cas system CSM-associated protein Csm3 (group 7 of RAMP superfamily)